VRKPYSKPTIRELDDESPSVREAVAQVTAEALIREVVLGMQRRAVRDRWYKVHPEWHELNRKRGLLGLRPVQPVDYPTKETFK
jgi:hypothetical protein